MTEPQESSKAVPPHHPEMRVLPPWLYPILFWLALPVLILSLLIPGAASIGLWYMMSVPVLAALIAAATQWKKDRRVSLAALIAAVGLGLVVLVKGWIT